MGPRPTPGVGKAAPVQQPLSMGTTRLPFVISPGEVMCLRPTQGDEKWVLFGNHTEWKRRPPLCHLDRSSEGA
jgi:hypothetical protein